MKKILKSISILLILSALQTNGQEVVSIDKTEAVSTMIEKNTTIKISIEEFNAAKAQYSQTNALFLPNITASHTGLTTTNPLVAFGSKLNQGIITQNDFNPALLNDPNRTQNFATVISIQQPLINLDGLYQRKAAKSKMEAMALKTKRTRDYFVFEMEKAYMQLQLAYRAVEVLEKALSTADANKKMAVNSFKQGLLQRADLLNVEVRVTEVKNQLQQAKSNVLNASNYISFLLNDKNDKVYKPSEELALSNLTTSENDISENRADIKALKLSLKAYENMNKADKMTFLPRLNAFGSYEMYDDKIFNSNANGYVIGATLSWDLFKGSKRFGKIKQSKAVLEKAKLNYNQYISKSNLELNRVKRQLQDSKSKLKLTKLSVEQSKESFRIRENRFKEGLEKTSDLLEAETLFAQKQLEYYQTIFEYNFTQSYLEFLTKE